LRKGKGNPVETHILIDFTIKIKLALRFTTHANGNFTALKKGTASITLTAGEQTAVFNVTVTLDTSSVTALVDRIAKFKQTIIASDNACKDNEGRMFTSVAQMQAIDAALATAESAIESASVNSDVVSIYNALKAAMDTFEASVKVAEHTWGEGVVTEAPTVDKKGKETFTCSVCGKTKTQSIRKLDPSETTVDDAQASVSGDDTTATEEKGGCGSSVAVGSFGILAVALCGTAIVSKKKKERK
jgi:hypothetical protein